MVSGVATQQVKEANGFALGL